VHPCSTNTRDLTVSAERNLVATVGGGAARGTHAVVEVALAREATGDLAGRGLATHLAVLHGRGADPVDAGVSADGVVLGVNKDDLEVLVGGVLSNPVGVFIRVLMG